VPIVGLEDDVIAGGDFIQALHHAVGWMMWVCYTLTVNPQDALVGILALQVALRSRFPSF